MSRVAGECAIIDIRSLPPGWSIRWSHRPLKYIAHSMSSSRRCSNDSTMPVSGDAVVTSDQRVSLARSSQGKLKIVASVMVVSSTETSLTQSLSSPPGSARSEEHTLTPVTNAHLVCRLLLEKKNHKKKN